MTVVQTTIFIILLMVAWVVFQVILEIAKTKILIKRQEEIVDKTVSRIYDQTARHIVKLYRDVQEVRRVL